MLEWWRRPRVWFVLGVAGLAVGAAGLVWFLGSEGRERADQWAGIIFGAVSAASVAAAALFWLWRQGDGGTAVDERVARGLAVLARGQREQWAAEQTARRVRDPWPLDIRWLVSPRAQAVMAGWGSVLGRRGAGPVALEGSYDQVAELFEQPGARRLVVLGEPGAGKSMLLLHLTLQMLERRADGDPVPVLLPVAGWRPGRSLDDWVAEQLSGINRQLAGTVEAPDGSRRSLARELVARDLVVPVLDGLDEIAEEAQRAVLSRLAGTDRRLVVSSRTRPYEAAVAGAGPVPGAAVVELQPLAASEAAQYLVDGADGRWAPVLSHLAEGRATPLVRALSTPLTIWLARNVYGHPSSDPGDLLTAPWAATREGIEQHLLEHLIPAAYTAAVGGHPARTAEEADRARHLLTVLARHMREHRTYDIAWWELSELRPGPAAQMVAVMLAVPVTFAALALGVLGLSGVESSSAAVGGVSGLMAGVMVAMGRMLFRDRRHPRRLVPAGLVRVFLAAGVPVGLLGSLGGPGTGLACLAAAGLTASLGAGGTVIPGGALGAAGPLASLRADRAACVTAGVAVGATGAILAALAWSAAGPARSPAGSAGPEAALAWPEAAPAMLFGALAGLVVVGLGAWGQLGLTRLLLAAFRGVPLRLVGALREAHDRGVLRQAGGHYQFRHNLLQDHLATGRSR